MQCSANGPLLVAKGKSHGFSRVSAGTWCIFSNYGGDDLSKLVFVQQRQDSCLVTRDTSEISLRLHMAIRMLLEVRWKTQCPFLVATLILGFLSIFNKSHASSPLEAFYSVCLSRCQWAVRHPFQMRQGHRTFSRVSTDDSDIPSVCEMKDAPTFKPLPGNPTFFRIRAPRCPYLMRQQIQGPSHIPIAEGSLLLRCLWKVGFHFSRSKGIRYHIEMT